MGTLNTVKNGKGSKPRPITNTKSYLENWDAIFSKKSLEKEKEVCDNPKNEEANSTSVKKNGLEG
jgi:hypothetical protein